MEGKKAAWTKAEGSSTVKKTLTLKIKEDSVKRTMSVKKIE